MKPTPTAAAAAMIALLQLFAASAQENAADPGAAGSAHARFEFTGLPPAGTQGKSLRFKIGPAAGFAASVASLSPDPDNPRLGIERLFIEIAATENGVLDGLRLFAERAGLSSAESTELSALADSLTVGSREGSLVRQNTGSPLGGGALLSAKRASLRLSTKRQEGSFRPRGNHADRGDAIHLRGEIWDLRFADAFTEHLFPALSEYPELQEILSGDGGFTLDADESFTRLSAAFGLNLDSRQLLKLSAGLTLSSTDGNAYAIEGFVSIDGAGSDGGAESTASAWARQMAEILADRAKAHNSGSFVVQAIQNSALEFSMSGQRATAEFLGTIPAHSPEADSNRRFSALYALAASLGQNVEKTAS